MRSAERDIGEPPSPTEAFWALKALIEQESDPDVLQEWTEHAASFMRTRARTAQEMHRNAYGAQGEQVREMAFEEERQAEQYSLVVSMLSQRGFVPKPEPVEIDPEPKGSRRTARRRPLTWVGYFLIVFGVLGVVRGGFWFAHGEPGPAVANFLIYGVSAAIGLAFVKSRGW